MKHLALTVCVLLFHAPLEAGNWAQFRGPHFNGSTEETNLPSDWSTTKNVVWATELPGASAASPVVWGDHIFISSADKEEKLCAICLDRKTGDILWRRNIADDVRKDPKSNFSSPTPATDGNLVVFFYGNGDLVTFDFDGNEIWKRNIQKDYGQFAFGWTFSTSPLLYAGKLYMQVLQGDTAVRGRGPSESYLLALDPKTGQELWRTLRPSKAVAESREAFTTPVPFEFNGRKELLVAGGDAISGHDPASGKELWRWGTWNEKRIGHWRLVPSPVAGDGVILACAPKKQPIYAVKAGGKGTLSDDDLAWVSREHRAISSDVPTPAFADGDFFVLGDGTRTLLRVDPQTGEAKWSARLPGRDKYEASPLVADGKVYVVDFGGHTSVYDMANGNQLASMQMVEKRSRHVIRSSIIAAQGQLFIRTPDKLFCIAKQ